MLGWLAPVVILPESFLALGEEAQCAVACHELLHARRHDWLINLFEELVGALLWFNPAIWMLLAQTRLAREQLVDTEVVHLTAAREPYIDALLAMARARQVLDLAPAPLFLRRRHLTQRIHLLLKEVSVSKLRLVFAYCSVTAILAFAGWFALISFPLTKAAAAPLTKIPAAAQMQASAPSLSNPPAPARPSVPTAVMARAMASPLAQDAEPTQKISSAASAAESTNKPDFSGTWKLQAKWSEVYVIEQSASGLRVLEQIDDSMGQRTLDVSGPIDGQPHEQTVDGFPCVFVAKWEGPHHNLLTFETNRQTKSGWLFNRRTMQLFPDGRVISARRTRLLPLPEETFTEVWMKQ
jgi:hypothetical protein